MSTTFSSDGENIIRKTFDITQLSPTSSEELEKVYDVQDTIKWIKKHNFQKPIMQFPIDQKNDCLKVAQAIKNRIERDVAICDDLSRGNCCVEEIQALKMGGDCILHYGQACLSPVRILPVFYIFKKSFINIDNCVQKFQEIFCNIEEKVIIVYAVEYCHVIDELQMRLKDYHHTVFSQIELGKTQMSNATQMLETKAIEICESDSNIIRMQSRVFKFPKMIDRYQYKVFFIGPDNLTLTNFALSFSKQEFYHYDPYSLHCTKIELETNRLLKRRYYMVERIRDSRRVGIIATTPLASDYAEECDRLHFILKNSGKRPLIIILGDISPAKVANFQDKDIFVLVGCPENICHFLDNREFHKPLVTSFEVELACNPAREWSGDYVTDFRQLLEDSINYVPLITRSENDNPDVSLIGGHIRTLENFSLNDDRTSSEILKRDEALSITKGFYSSEDVLSQRFWKGLEQQLGQTEVTKAVEGQSGIAIGYENEINSTLNE